MRRLLVVLLCLVPTVVLAQANDVGKAPLGTIPAPAGFPDAASSGSMSFTGAEATMSPRLFRPGAPHTTCSTTGSGNYQYRTVAFTSDGSGSLTLTIDPGSCLSGNYIYPAFYTSFNPADICAGFVWAPGSSPDTGTTYAPFTVTPSTPMVMVVGASNTNAPGVVCGPITYSIAGTTGVPTMGQWALILLAMVLTASAVWMLMRRRRLQLNT
jgi:hypothetical protein